MASGGVLNLDLSHITEGLFTNDVKVANAQGQAAIGIAQVNAATELEAAKQRNKLITGIAIGFGILVAIVATVFALK